MRNAATAAVNLATLLIGIAIGFLLAHYPPRGVFAQTPPQIEEIFVGATFPAAAFGTLLASRIATDEITSRGLDLVKLHENTLNLLASKTLWFTAGEIQGVIEKSKTKVLRMKEPQAKGGEKK